jgi:RNA polymerase sigma factor (sigma-70 family)
MEASALTHAGKIGLLGRSPALLRLQGDERLVAAIRRQNPTAFEVLFDRYRSRLLAFCRSIVGSTEDAEDVLQDVFVAAHSAMLADERPINLKPWLYRIARNRSLNHLRKPVADGQDTMDLLPASGGSSTADTAASREEIRAIFADVSELPETQRAALVLREIDDLSYDEIAQALGTTLPSVKSLLVRARISLAEASEARVLTCDEVRLELAEAAEGIHKVGGGARHHIRKCERCRRYRSELRSSSRALAALSAPFGLLAAIKHFIAAKFGGGAGTGSATAGSGGTAGAGGVGAGAGSSAGVAGGVGATGAGVGATATAAVGGGALGGTGGLIGGGAAIGAVGAKAAGSFATAALLTAGAVGVGHYAEQRAHNVAPHARYAQAPAASHHKPLHELIAHHHAATATASSVTAEAPVETTAPTEPTATPPADTPAEEPAPAPATDETYTDSTGQDGGTGSTSDGSGSTDDPTASGSSDGDGEDGTEEPPPVVVDPPDEPPPTDPPPTDPPPGDPPADPPPVILGG